MPHHILQKEATMLNAAMICSVAVVAETVLVFAAVKPLPSAERLVMWCLIGSIGGAFLSIAVWSPLTDKNPQWGFRRLCLQFFSSGVLGVLFSPFAINWLELDPNLHTAMAVAGAMSMCGVWLVHKMAPRLESIVDSKLDAYAGKLRDQHAAPQPVLPPPVSPRVPRKR